MRNTFDDLSRWQQELLLTECLDRSGLDYNGYMRTHLFNHYPRKRYDLSSQLSFEKETEGKRR